MTIETKFNIDDNVYVMHHNKVTLVRIRLFDVRVSASGIFITYETLSVVEGYLVGGITEDKVFSTKQELLNSL